MKLFNIYHIKGGGMPTNLTEEEITELAKSYIAQNVTEEDKENIIRELSAQDKTRFNVIVKKLAMQQENNKVLAPEQTQKSRLSANLQPSPHTPQPATRTIAREPRKPGQPPPQRPVRPGTPQTSVPVRSNPVDFKRRQLRAKSAAATIEAPAIEKVKNEVKAFLEKYHNEFEKNPNIIGKVGRLDALTHRDLPLDSPESIVIIKGFDNQIKKAKSISELKSVVFALGEEDKNLGLLLVVEDMLQRKGQELGIERIPSVSPSIDEAKRLMTNDKEDNSSPNRP